MNKRKSDSRDDDALTLGNKHDRNKRPCLCHKRTFQDIFASCTKPVNDLRDNVDESTSTSTLTSRWIPVGISYVNDGFRVVLQALKPNVPNKNETRKLADVVDTNKRDNDNNNNNNNNYTYNKTDQKPPKKHGCWGYLCQTPGCAEFAIYGNQPYLPVACTTHRKETMYDVRVIKCQHSDCNNEAVYFKSLNDANTHKKWKRQQDDVDNEQLWPLLPQPAFCRQHLMSTLSRKDQERYLQYKISALCQHPTCVRKPEFGYKRDGDEDHDDAIDDTNQMMPAVTMDYSVSGGARTCVSHRMYGSRRMRGRFCTVQGCNTMCSYGYEKSKPLVCYKHRKPDMYNVVTTKCSEPNCTRNALRKYTTETHHWCSEHVPPSFAECDHHHIARSDSGAIHTSSS